MKVLDLGTITASYMRVKEWDPLEFLLPADPEEEKQQLDEKESWLCHCSHSLSSWTQVGVGGPADQEVSGMYSRKQHNHNKIPPLA